MVNTICSQPPPRPLRHLTADPRSTTTSLKLVSGLAIFRQASCHHKVLHSSSRNGSRLSCEYRQGDLHPAQSGPPTSLPLCCPGRPTVPELRRHSMSRHV